MVDLVRVGVGNALVRLMTLTRTREVVIHDDGAELTSRINDLSTSQSTHFEIKGGCTMMMMRFGRQI